MRYRLYGNELQLVKYKITVHHEPEEDIEAYTDTFLAASDAERDKYLKRYTDAVVEEVDNSGYEWLNGMTFTQEQLRKGELKQAIEMGEDAYMAMKNAPSQDEINAMLLLQIAELTAEVNGNE